MHYIRRSEDVRICTRILLVALAYAVAHQLWDDQPELFFGADALDKIFNAVALGYIASYVFFIVVVLIPRTLTHIRKVELARDHMHSYVRILKSFENDTGVKVEESSREFVEKYVRERMELKECSISLCNHLGGWEHHTCVTLGSFVRRLAKKMEYSCPILQDLVGNNERLYKAIDRVQLLAFEVLNPDPDIPDILQGGGSINYPGLLVQIRNMTNAFHEVHGLDYTD